VVGVTIDHTMAKNDPEHFSIEGSGVMVRGLPYVRSELNGRDSFSANGGRALNFEDVPPELMAGVDVYKNPSAEQIEGGVAGLINLRTYMPFDFTGPKVAASVSESYSTLRGKWSPSVSGMFSDRWNLDDLGQVGFLIDLAHSESATRTDAFQVEPYYPLPSNGGTIWVPKGAEWRTLDFDRKRDGLFGALQWKKNDVQSSLTYFKSRYDMDWSENAIFSQVGTPYNITVDPGATFDSHGALVKGTIRDDADGGINFGADTRIANRKSDTQDISWNVNWKASDHWAFNTDLQYIRASTGSFDSTVATGTMMAKEQLDLSGAFPNLMFDAADKAALVDPANYYWAFTMEHKDRSIADEKALRLDAKYTFEDSVLSDFRFGLRLTDRNADTTNSVPGYNWAAITQPWQVGWDISHLAYLNDPRFSGGTHTYSFPNFFNGKASVPTLIFPDTSLALNYPASYQQLHSYHDILCAEQAAAQGWSSGCPAWTPASFGTDPAGNNDQDEHTQALYGQLRFGFDNLAYPVDGNVGMRMVRTEMLAHGYTVLDNQVTLPTGDNSYSGVPVPPLTDYAVAETFKNAYNDFLPSLNLRMKAGNEWQYRFAYSKAITRPDFSQLQAYTTLTQTATGTSNNGIYNVESVSDTGTGTGNPMLKPIKSNQVDVTAEWYFAKTGSLTFAVFDKQLKDIIINQTYAVMVPDANGNPVPFVTTAPVNGAKGYARGLEVAFQRYFDMLPGWLSGFGVQANYTFVDSRQTLYSPVNQPWCGSSNGGAANLNLNLNGCDTNGQTFGDLPLENLSRNAYNLALLYDQGPVSARLAYSWRSRYLQNVNVNGTQGTDGTDSNPASPTYGQHNIAWGLPVWADDYGQLDASIFYKLSENVTLGLEGSNLTDAMYKQLMQQHIGMKGRAWFTTGPVYQASLHYTF
jgi:TonB-dependent receptor